MRAIRPSVHYCDPDKLLGVVPATHRVRSDSFVPSTDLHGSGELMIAVHTRSV